MSGPFALYLWAMGDVLPWMLASFGLGVAVALLLAVRPLARLYALRWRRAEEQAIRQDAVARSGAALRGRASEQLAPLLPGFPFCPGDARFLGSPVDFVVFDGLGDGELHEVVFVEVKSGTASLSGRERRVRDAVQAGRVSWFELRLP